MEKLKGTQEQSCDSHCKYLKKKGMSSSYTHPAPCTRSAWCVVGALSTSCQNNENQSAPTVQGLGCTPGLNCQVGNRADEQKGIDSGRRAGVKERGIDGQPAIHRQWSQGKFGKTGWTSQLW